MPQPFRVRPMPFPHVAGQRNAPVRVRQHFGDLPNDQGGPGSPLFPYSEHGVYGDGSQFSAGGTAPITQPPPDVGQPPPALTPQQLSMISTPVGQSDRPWMNPCTYATVPLFAAIGPGVAGDPVLGQLPVLSLNYQRNALIIQNSSTADTTTGDFAPTIWIGFNASPLEEGALALPPGLGFFWGAQDPPPRDSIYVLIGEYDNTNNTVVFGGCIVQGTYAPKG